MNYLGGVVGFWVVFGAQIFSANAALTPPTVISGQDVRDGKAIELKVGTPARATVVAFLSARCPCSSSHEKPLKQLAEKFSPQGIAFVAVHSNADETRDEAAAHFKAASLPFAVLSDESDQRLANQFGALKTPHVYVVSPTGEILYRGGVDDSSIADAAKEKHLEAALTDIAAGRKPARAETRVLGCVIRRK